MRLQFNLESSALYILDGEVEETRDLAEPGFSAHVNVDGEGNVLGLEFLSLKEYAELTTRLGSTLETHKRVEESASFQVSFPPNS